MKAAFICAHGDQSVLQEGNLRARAAVWIGSKVKSRRLNPHNMFLRHGIQRAKAELPSAVVVGKVIVKL